MLGKKKLKQARGKTKTGVVMEKKNRNGATGREVYTGQLGLLNHDPEEQTQKPIVEKKNKTLILWSLRICSPNVFVLVGVNEASITK